MLSWFQCFKILCFAYPYLFHQPVCHSLVAYVGKVEQAVRLTNVSLKTETARDRQVTIVCFKQTKKTSEWKTWPLYFACAAQCCVDRSCQSIFRIFEAWSSQSKSCRSPRKGSETKIHAVGFFRWILAWVSSLRSHALHEIFASYFYQN